MDLRLIANLIMEMPFLLLTLLIPFFAVKYAQLTFINSFNTQTTAVSAFFLASLNEKL